MVKVIFPEESFWYSRAQTSISRWIKEANSTCLLAKGTATKAGAVYPGELMDALRGSRPSTIKSIDDRTYRVEIILHYIPNSGGEVVQVIKPSVPVIPK